MCKVDFFIKLRRGYFLWQHRKIQLCLSSITKHDPHIYEAQDKWTIFCSYKNKKEGTFIIIIQSTSKQAQSRRSESKAHVHPLSGRWNLRRRYLASLNSRTSVFNQISFTVPAHRAIRRTRRPPVWSSAPRS